MFGPVAHSKSQILWDTLIIMRLVRLGRIISRHRSQELQNLCTN